MKYLFIITSTHQIAIYNSENVRLWCVTGLLYDVLMNAFSVACSH